MTKETSKLTFISDSHFIQTQWRNALGIKSEQAVAELDGLERGLKKSRRKQLFLRAGFWASFPAVFLISQIALTPVEAIWTAGAVTVLLYFIGGKTFPTLSFGADLIEPDFRDLLPPDPHPETETFLKFWKQFQRSDIWAFRGTGSKGKGFPLKHDLALRPFGILTLMSGERPRRFVDGGFVDLSKDWYFPTIRSLFRDEASQTDKMLKTIVHHSDRDEAIQFLKELRARVAGQTRTTRAMWVETAICAIRHQELGENAKFTTTVEHLQSEGLPTTRTTVIAAILNNASYKSFEGVIREEIEKDLHTDEFTQTALIHTLRRILQNIPQ